MLRNYRKIGTTNASYISGLGSGKSQGGGEILLSPLKDTLTVSFLTLQKFSISETITSILIDKPTL